MELKNEFEVTVPLGDAWDILTDVERIAPCLPGAEFREVDGDEYRGVVKVKLGPISAEYRGTRRASWSATTSSTELFSGPRVGRQGAKEMPRPRSRRYWIRCPKEQRSP